MEEKTIINRIENILKKYDKEINNRLHEYDEGNTFKLDTMIQLYLMGNLNLNGLEQLEKELKMFIEWLEE